MTTRLTVVRHGETSWNAEHRVQGQLDVFNVFNANPVLGVSSVNYGTGAYLRPSGILNGRTLRLGAQLARFSFTRVFTSPLQRASKTCQLAGYGAIAQVDPDLVEWDYGRFEGMRTREILREQPGWELFRDGCPGGESVARRDPRRHRRHSARRSSRGWRALHE